VTVAVIAFVAIVIVLNLLARALDESVGGNQPAGEAGSSFATSASGLAAYAELLADYGHPVERVRGDLTESSLDTGATLFVTAPTSGALVPADLQRVREFVQTGGHAVLVEFDRFALETVTGASPVIVSGSESYRDISPELTGIAEVRSDGDRGYELDSVNDALVRDPDNVLLTRVAVGAGEVLLLADLAPVENAWIGEADNAALGLALPATDTAPVLFAEGVHGYGEQTGLAAIPSRWKVALLAIGAAGVVFAWSRARRLGAPDQPSRALPPARAAYVDALAATLTRTDDPPAALAHLSASLRDRVKQRAGLPPDADQAAVAAAAASIGLTENDVAALWRSPASDRDVLALGTIARRVHTEPYEGANP
jgi:hypothetical protein